jgi:hypothetical protein
MATSDRPPKGDRAARSVVVGSDLKDCMFRRMWRSCEEALLQKRLYKD